MPVATREASVYVGMTIGEYYRNMGHKVLVLADSTSRWAQSLREISNRLEELPGPDAYPVELSATVANFYSRAGYVELNNGKFGSVTFIGTVSPAGGNFKEPVTESTRKVASCFYALSQKRADAKRYPAIDPVASYSKYLEYDEFRNFTNENIEEGWTDYVNKALDIIRMGIEARDHINILGDDAVPPEYHVRFWRRETFDFAFIQQDSFDDIDMNTPLDRQRYMLHKILDICEMDFEFMEFIHVSEFYKKVINLLRQMNFNEFKSSEFLQYEKKLEKLLSEKKAEIVEV
jgi:V/A-type H+-transporting ATPase subunit A